MRGKCFIQFADDDTVIVPIVSIMKKIKTSKLINDFLSYFEIKKKNKMFYYSIKHFAIEN